MNHAVQMELDPLEEHLLERLRALPAGERRRRPRPRRSGARRSAAGCATSPPATLKDTGPELLLDRLGGARENAAVALALRPTDPALLHYRSGAFYLARAGAGGARRRARHPAGA